MTILPSISSAYVCAMRRRKYHTLRHLPPFFMYLAKRKELARPMSANSPLYELGNYHVLGRIHYFVPYHPSPLHPGRVLTTFGAISLVIEVLNGHRRVLRRGADAVPGRRCKGRGRRLLQAALIMQLAVVALFVALAVMFQARAASTAPSSTYFDARAPLRRPPTGRPPRVVLLRLPLRGHPLMLAGQQRAAAQRPPSPPTSTSRATTASPRSPAPDTGTSPVRSVRNGQG
ncbi:hypothetical protein F5X96DRAFT_452577 [Biscogniauxia mediterranea]|nr:hypothetical protein F5X96DRAFT_452577 [Biscogniauxia mediterranea]